MTRDHILAIDNGTQSVRALLFDPRGNLLAKSRVPIEPYFSTQPGYAEQNPEVFWQAVCAACQQLWPMPGVSKDSIAGVALTTQRGTIINLDQNGQPPRRYADTGRERVGVMVLVIYTIASIPQRGVITHFLPPALIAPA